MISTLSPVRPPADLSFADRTELDRLAQLAADLYRSGQPGLGEEIDRCRARMLGLIAELNEARSEIRIRDGKLRAMAQSR